MGTTTSNQGKGITTTTSDHEAKSNGASDVCKTPPTPTPVGYTNSVKTTVAVKHTSPKTLFSGGMVVRKDDDIGPPSVGDDPGVVGGTQSGTHKMEAWVVKGSPNMYAEGKPVGRTGDDTKMNHGNTDGRVFGGNPQAAVSEARKKVLLLCSLDTTEGECEHGRKAGEDRLLQITEGTVKLEAKRKNAKTGGPPECSEGPHTLWRIVKTQAGKPPKEEERAGDELELEEEWFDWTFVTDFGEAKTKARSKKEDFAREAKKQVRDPRVGPGPGQAERVEARKEARDKFMEGKQEKNKDIAMYAQDAAQIVLNLPDFLRVWKADQELVQVTVEALACSGAHKYTIQSFPEKEAKFKISMKNPGKDKTVEKLKASVKRVQDLFKSFKEIATAAGVQVEVEILEELEFEMKCEWKEMTKDVPELKKYKHHVDFGWDFALEAIIAKLKFNYRLPILSFVNMFFPSAGSALDWLARKLSLDASINVGVDFELKAGVKAERKPGELSPVVGGEVTVKLEPYLNVKIKWKTRVEIKGELRLKFSIKIKLEAPTINLFEAHLAVGQGEVKLGCVGTFSVDIYFWSESWQAEYWPEWAKTTWPGFKLPFLGALHG